MQFTEQESGVQSVECPPPHPPSSIQRKVVGKYEILIWHDSECDVKLYDSRPF